MLPVLSIHPSVESKRRNLENYLMKSDNSCDTTQEPITVANLSSLTQAFGQYRYFLAMCEACVLRVLTTFFWMLLLA
jgi:hypothetical protein